MFTILNIWCQAGLSGEQGNPRKKTSQQWAHKIKITPAVTVGVSIWCQTKLNWKSKGYSAVNQYISCSSNDHNMHEHHAELSKARLLPSCVAIHPSLFPCQQSQSSRWLAKKSCVCSRLGLCGQTFLHTLFHFISPLCQLLQVLYATVTSCCIQQHFPPHMSALIRELSVWNP